MTLFYTYGIYEWCIHACMAFLKSMFMYSWNIWKGVSLHLGHFWKSLFLLKAYLHFFWGRMEGGEGGEGGGGTGREGGRRGGGGREREGGREMERDGEEARGGTGMGREREGGGGRAG